MALASFTPSVTGLAAQSQALGTVSTNIANIRTVGYRPVETQFQTLLGTTPATGNSMLGDSSSRVGINGVTAHDRTLISQRGNVTPTGGNFDVAIDVGNGFFMVEDSASDVYYTRAGNFTTLTQNGVTYLVANNGYYVDGFAANGNNGFAGAPSKIIVDAPSVSPIEPTTKVSISANVPATDVDRAVYTFKAYGENNEGDGHNVSMIFTKDERNNNVWDVTFSMVDGMVTPSEPVRVVFNSDGTLLSPKNMAITASADDGSVNNITIDIAGMTQYAGGSAINDISQDGKASSTLLSVYVDGYGVLKAEYENGELLNLAKLAVVGFQSPENLIQVNGTMFEVSNDTGQSYYVIGPDTMNSSVLTSQAVESSPVNLEKEFSDLIIVQRAYTLNTTSFTTNNEMLQTAVNILS